MRTKPKVGDIVKYRVPDPEDGVGYIVATEGIHVWVRFFDNAAKGESYDVYIRRGDLEIISRGKS